MTAYLSSSLRKQGPIRRVVSVQRCGSDLFHRQRQGLWIPPPVRNCALGKDDELRGRRRTTAFCAASGTRTLNYCFLRRAAAGVAGSTFSTAASSCSPSSRQRRISTASTG